MKELLQPLSTHDIRIRYPDGTVATGSNHQIDLYALLGIGICYVKGRLGTPNDNSFSRCLDGLALPTKVFGVEIGSIEHFGSRVDGEVGLRSQSRSYNDLCGIHLLLLLSTLGLQLPTAIGCRLERVHSCEETCSRKDTKLLGEVGEVLVQNTSGDVVVVCDAVVLGYHREIGILIGAMQVVGFKASVEPVFRPCASTAALCF